jgi:hypothetical protein
MNYVVAGILVFLLVGCEGKWVDKDVGPLVQKETTSPLGTQEDSQKLTIVSSGSFEKNTNGIAGDAVIVMGETMQLRIIRFQALAKANMRVAILANGERKDLGAIKAYKGDFMYELEQGTYTEVLITKDKDVLARAMLS